jgi:hypothetical protein
MDISAVSSRPFAATQGSDGFAKARQSFQNLGKALDAGNMDDARKALTQMQSNAPAQGNGANSPMGANNPMNAKMETLTKAVESGDLKAAQGAYADIKETMSRQPSGGGGRAGGAGGPPPGGGAPPKGAGKPSETSASSDPTKVYEPEDADEDGTVTWMEEQDYKRTHPEEADKASTMNKVDVLA